MSIVTEVAAKMTERNRVLALIDDVVAGGLDHITAAEALRQIRFIVNCGATMGEGGRWQLPEKPNNVVAHFEDGHN
jgi:hypothetical protein